MIWFGGLDLYAYDPVGKSRVKNLPIPFPASGVDNLLTTRPPDMGVHEELLVASFDGAKWQHFDVSNGLLHNTIIAGCELSSGGILISTDRDISRFDGRTWANFSLPVQFDMQREEETFGKRERGHLDQYFVARMEAAGTGS